MPFCWDCRGTQADKENMEGIGDLAFTIGLVLMKVKKKSYPELYIETLTLTKKDVKKVAEFLTLHQVLNQKGIPNTLKQNTEIVEKFIGSKFWRR